MRVFAIYLFLFFVFIVKAQASSVCFNNSCINVEVVSKKDDLRKGLQGREFLDDNQGMLFVFSSDDVYGFWMKDMKISIDMLWLDAQGKIVTIAPSRKPCQQEPCEVFKPNQKARFVLEVADGFVGRHQLNEGDALQLKDIN